MSTATARIPSLREVREADGHAERLVVGIGDMQLTAGDGKLIMTYGLGSCLGITLWDPEARVGAMLHAMLPTSRLATEKTRTNPFMFVDTGVPETFRRCYAAGADRRRIQCRVAGGACTHSNPASDVFQIGAKNFAVLDALLKKNGIGLLGKDVGGHHSRTLIFDIATGRVTIHHGQKETEL